MRRRRLWTALLCLALALGRGLVSHLDPLEYAQLFDLYTVAGGAYWTWDPYFAKFGKPWNFSSYREHDPCREFWQGVLCSTIRCPRSGCRIFSLTLTNLNLSNALPPVFENFTSLMYLTITENKLLRGSPPLLLNAPALQVLNMSGNGFTGTIPAYDGRLTALIVLSFPNNFLRGTIPETLYDIDSLKYLNFDHNLLSGSISAKISQLTQVTSLGFRFNKLSGALPSAIFSLPMLTDLYLRGNKLTGRLGYAGFAAKLRVLAVEENLLTGTIPHALCLCLDLAKLALHHNRFEGSLPACLSQLSRLEYLQVQSNAFAGSLAGVFPAQHRLLNLSVVDLSDNKFTGELPPALFALPRLESLAAVKNCFHGRLPESICSANRDLSILALDGMASSDRCRAKLWDPLHIAKSYLSGVMAGSIPACVWSLPNLSVLHLSCNAFTGTLPDLPPQQLSPRLRDVTLSYNKLTGSIPKAIQTFAFDTLDLSHNKLAGSLDGSLNFSLAYSPTSNASNWDLTINRLSGALPSAFTDAYNIKVLEGNLFGCRGEDSLRPLAKHDPEGLNYSCGSSEFDRAMAAFVVLLLLAAALLLLGACMRRHRVAIRQRVSRAYAGLCFVSASCDRLALVLDEAPAADCAATGDLSLEKFVNISNFLAAMTMIRRLAVAVALYVVLICTPVYLSLYAIGDEYSTHKHHYSWVLSSVHLTGDVPAIALTLLLAPLLLAVLSYVLCAYQPLRLPDAGPDDDERSADRDFLRALVGGGEAAADDGDDDGGEEDNRPTVSLDRSVDTQRLLGSFSSSCSTVTPHMVTTDTATTSGTFLPLLRVSELLTSAKLPAQFSAKYALVCSFNTVVNIAVNILYVMLLDDDLENSSLKSLLQVSMAAFKALWNLYMVRWLVAILSTRRQHISAYVLLLAFNTLLAPCLATAFTDSQCFKNCFFAVPSVTACYYLPSCVQSHEEMDIVTNEFQTVCTQYSYYEYMTQFQQSFIYYYTCMSTLLMTYIPVFVYTYTFLLLLLPAVYLLLTSVDLRRFPRWLAHRMDAVLRPAEPRASFDQLLRPYSILALQIQHLIILLTFGLSSAVLAVVLALFLVVDTYMWQWLVLRYLYHDFDPSPFAAPLTSSSPPASPRAPSTAARGLFAFTYQPLSLVSGMSTSGETEAAALQRWLAVDDCCDAAHRSVGDVKWLLFFSGSCFLMLKLFNVVGDSHGWQGALWTAVAGVAFMVLVPLLWPRLLRAARRRHAAAADAERKARKR